MIWLYRLLFLPGLGVALPYYLLRLWRRGGYRRDFQHRLGLFRHLPPTAPGKQRIWLQAVSVGEILAIGPLVEALQKNGDVEIILTTTTSTGYEEARKHYKEVVCGLGIFPLDFWLFSITAWKRIQPDAVILTESELWPEHLYQARKRDVPTFLVNARISARSFARYRKFRSLAARLLGQLDHIYAATDHDRKCLLALGGNDVRVTCSGSIKFDVTLPERLDAAGKNALRAELGFPADDFILLGSSTWPGEEAALLAIQQKLIAAGTACSLLVIPRHSERGPELARLLKAQSLPWHQRSRGSSPQGEVRVHLADTTGELAQLTQAADLAFIGKSLPPGNGGQTPIEAAGLGIPILMGPNMTNFKTLAQSLVRNRVACFVQDVAELEQQITVLIPDSATRARMSEAGLKWHRKNRGSSRRIAEGILTDLRHGREK